MYGFFNTVPTSIDEAARIDGAGWFNRLRFVTIPHLLPTIKLLFILQVISVFQVFYEPMVMTGGGPNGASMSLLLLSYNYYFLDMDASASAAVAVIHSGIIILLTLLYLRLSRPKGERKRA